MLQGTVKEAFNNVLNTFTGADGGIKFVMLRCLLEDFQQRTIDNNDEAAQTVLNVVIHMSNLIDVAQKAQNCEENKV